MTTVLLRDQVCVDPTFCLNQTTLALNELIGRPTATWVLCVF